MKKFLYKYIICRIRGHRKIGITGRFFWTVCRDCKTTHRTFDQKR